MSENQGIRPEDNSAPSSPSVPPVPPMPAAPAGAAPTGGTRPVPNPTQPTQPYPGQGFGVPPQAPHTPEKKKSSGGGGRVVGLLVAAALVGGAAGIGGTWAGNNLWTTAGSSSTAQGPQVVTVNDTDSVNATAAIATKVVPSVVTINVQSGQSGGTGSGVVLSKDGYVLTNTHVVTIDGESAHPSISVTTSNGHIYSATIVGTDPVYDLAVIKLQGATDMTPITWGDSSQLNVGDQTVAIGAPLGLSNTVTTGIVSALNRSIEIASSAAPDSGQNGDQGDEGDNPFFFDFGQGPRQTQASESIKIAVIQTDAPINPGNSGGALVDDEGKLVGINVAIASAGSSSSSSQSGSIGVGFSIPSDIAHRVADDLMKDGTTTHGLLGASVRDAAGVQGVSITGAYIVGVTDGGGAADGGMRAGDIVTKFNGVPITGAVDLTAQVRALATGSKADVTYVRDGRTETTQVTLGTLKG